MWANLSSIPLLVLLVPPLALFGGSFSLYQFSVMYVNLARLVQRPATGSIWKAVRPYARTMVRTFITGSITRKYHVIVEVSCAGDQLEPCRRLGRLKSCGHHNKYACTSKLSIMVLCLSLSSG